MNYILITYNGDSDATFIYDNINFNLQVNVDIKYVVSQTDQHTCKLIVGSHEYFFNIFENDSNLLTFEIVNIEKNHDRIINSLKDKKIYIYEIENKLLHDIVLQTGQEKRALQNVMKSMENHVTSVERRVTRLKRRMMTILLNHEIFLQNLSAEELELNELKNRLLRFQESLQEVLQ